MKIVQLIGADGQNIGLYTTDKDYSLKTIQILFDGALNLSKSMNDEIDVQETADSFLNYHGITRVFVEEVTTEIL